MSGRDATVDSASSLDSPSTGPPPAERRLKPHAAPADPHAAPAGPRLPAASSGRRVIVLGGTSEIVLAIVRELQARAPREVVLAGRDRALLGAAAESLRALGSPHVSTLELDAFDIDRHEEAIARAFAELDGADIVILAIGVLGQRGGLPSDIPEAVRTLQVNLVGAGSLLMRAAGRMRERGGGAIVVLSSVAAERPRRAGAVYGASKAGLDALAQALGDDLRQQGVRVLVVRPGFVRTRMTRGLDPAPLATTPQRVAEVTIAGLDRDAHTVWAPPALRWLMLLARMLPRPLFRRIDR
jgi:decaprenylphospho-beta-D-erythro-pentofuranosid-2-ulose 2-reductase